jgi:CRP/FNR family cyclic AMP-dependent transcriptional regulator
MKTKLPSRKVEGRDVPSPLKITGHEPLSADQLASLSFFSGFSKKHLEEIAPHTMISRFATGAPIMEQGSLADRFYVLLSGRVAVEYHVPGSTLKVEEIGPGETIGFSWLFMPEKLHFTTRALEPVTAVFCFGTLLRAECERSPRLGFELMNRIGKVMLHRLEALVEKQTEEARRLEEATWRPDHELGPRRLAGP